MTLAQLRYLVAIIDSNLNITLAAERVHATQPGISKQLKLLEEELGFPIFIRKGKSLDRLTAGGTEVISRARAILAEASNIRTLAANHRGEAGGELRIATTQTQARFFLPPSLKDLQARFPGVSVRLNMLADIQEAARVENDLADLLIISATERSEVGDLAIPLYRWKRVLVLPGGHPLTHLAAPISLADIAAHPLIGYESLLAQGSSVAKALAAQGLELQLAYAAQDVEVIKSYVRSGFGVGLLPQMAVSAEDLTDLVTIEVDHLFPTCTTWAVLPASRVARDYAVALVKSLAPHIAARDIDRLVKGTPLPAQAAVRWWSEAATVPAPAHTATITPFIRPDRQPVPASQPWRGQGEVRALTGGHSLITTHH
jgi:LysR family cys regulon transcriptional activator